MSGYTSGVAEKSDNRKHHHHCTNHTCIFQKFAFHLKFLVIWANLIIFEKQYLLVGKKLCFIDKISDIYFNTHFQKGIISILPYMSSIVSPSSKVIMNLCLQAKTAGSFCNANVCSLPPMEYDTCIASSSSGT